MWAESLRESTGDLSQTEELLAAKNSDLEIQGCDYQNILQNTTKDLTLLHSTLSR